MQRGKALWTVVCFGCFGYSRELGALHSQQHRAIECRAVTLEPCMRTCRFPRLPGLQMWSQRLDVCVRDLQWTAAVAYAADHCRRSSPTAQPPCCDRASTKCTPALARLTT